MVPGIFGFFSADAVDSLVQTYPQDLEISIKDGKVITNQPEPYYLRDTFDSGKDNLLVIDTETPFDGGQFAGYSTHVLLKQDYAVIADNEGERLVALSSVEDFTLTQAVLVGVAEQVYPYLGSVATVASVLLWFVLWIADAATLIYILFAALLVLLLTKVMKRGLSYKESYKTAVHAATLPIIVATLLDVFGVGMPFLTYSLLLVVVAYINLRATTQEVSQVPAAKVEPQEGAESAPVVAPVQSVTIGETVVGQ